MYIYSFKSTGVIILFRDTSIGTGTLLKGTVTSLFQGTGAFRYFTGTAIGTGALLKGTVTSPIFTCTGKVHGKITFFKGTSAFPLTVTFIPTAAV